LQFAIFNFQFAISLVAASGRLRMLGHGRIPKKTSPSSERIGPGSRQAFDLKLEPSLEGTLRQACYGFLASGSPYSPRPSHPVSRTVTIRCGFRPRLQWRGRAGLAPASQSAFPIVVGREYRVCIRFAGFVNRYRSSGRQAMKEVVLGSQVTSLPPKGVVACPSTQASERGRVEIAV